MLHLPYQIVLGSQSPRRRELLAGLDIPFEVRPMPQIDESYPADLPLSETARYIACHKAEAYLPQLAERELLITADTVVIVGETILGKPASRAEAVDMILQLAGRTHTVSTGVALALADGVFHNFSAETLVSFSPLSRGEAEYYVDHYRPYDKAGAYGIQEWIGYIAIERIEGSFYNVMGLPMVPLYQALKALQARS